MEKHKVTVASDTKVYLATSRLLDEILDIIPNLPRDYKYTVGAQMQNLTIGCLLTIQRAFMFKHDREDHLKEFLGDFDVLRTLVRKAGERQWISRKRHTTIAELMSDIGKQVTAWKNHPSQGEGRNPGGQG